MPTVLFEWGSMIYTMCLWNMKRPVWLFEMTLPKFLSQIHLIGMWDKQFVFSGFKLYKPVHNGQIYNWYQWSSVYNELNWKKCYCYNNLNYTKICAILVKQIKKYVALFRFEIKQMNESKFTTK